MRSCFLSSFIEFCLAVSEEKSKMCQPIRSSAAILFFRSAQKKNPTNLVQDVDILLPVNFRRNQFSGFREEVENVSANQRSGSHHVFFFFRLVQKTQFGKGRWDLASWQVSLNSVQSIQRRSRKCPTQPIRGRAVILFSIGPKNNNLVVNVEILLPVKFQLRSAVSEENSKMSGLIRGRGSPLVFRSAEKHVNLVENVGILLLVKFRWILLSGFREEVENVKS